MSSAVLLGIGNPLLDISSPVPSSFLEKYGVKVNNAILAEPTHLPMYEELAALPSVEYIAGGATQNSIRLAQWMLNEPGATAYIGCIGKDKFGAQLRDCATKDGVSVHYLENEAVPTGTCAVLIDAKERSLIANLGAANHYKPDHLQSEPIQQVIQNAKIFYSAGFFLTVSPPALMQIAEHALQHNKILAMNLSAPFIAQFFSEPLLAALPYADFMFGNESEAEAFGQKMGYADCSPENVARQIANYEKKNSARKRIAVITQGSSCTIVATPGKITKYDVPALDSSLIVDTNGAGDSFVGGFLAVIARGGSIDAAVDAGHYAARMILQQSGIVLPKHAPEVNVRA